ncbi:MAG: response regulator [Ignavibacteriaceae bacterium]
MKVLVVEDSEFIRKEILGILKKFKSFLLFEADNGRKALEIFQNENPDVVILDLGLPYISGFEVLRKIKCSNTTVKVIVLTNHGEKYFVDICLKYGADYFFDKSTQFEEFITTFESIHAEFKTQTT